MGAFYQLNYGTIALRTRILHSQQKKGKLYISLFIFIYPFGVMEVLTDITSSFGAIKASFVGWRLLDKAFQFSFGHLSA
jgi:hypothetical protein